MARRLSLRQIKQPAVQGQVLLGTEVPVELRGMRLHEPDALRVAPLLQPGQWAWVDGLAAILGEASAAPR